MSRRDPAPRFDPPRSADEWDARYSTAERIWSGKPNEVLVTEVADLPPGRALDIGCGEGADAVWLARRGWRVTGIDLSRVALDRAAAAARAADVTIDLFVADLMDAALPSGRFDLVSAFYPTLPGTDDRAAERILIDAVAPGGTLLVVHHVDFGQGPGGRHGFDRSAYVGPRQVLAALETDEWTIEADEVRGRRVSGGAGARHWDDRVLRARRRSHTDVSI